MLGRIREVLVKNAAECKLCGDVIQSNYRNDFKRCKCGEIFVDGGLEYARAGFTNIENIIDLCEYKNEYIEIQK